MNSQAEHPRDAPPDSPLFVTSRYNFFFPLPDGEGVLAYNSVMNSLLAIGGALHEELVERSGGAGPFPLDDAMRPLAAHGFLVPSTFDELDAIRQRKRGLQSDRGSLGLTIAPTLSCNFGCAYCFQEHPPAFMSREVEAALVRWVESEAERSLQGMGVSWFGGEPLLAPKTILRLSQAFSALSQRYGFELRPANIITNGWGLTRANCRLLAECGIASMQVTLDGLAELHDQRRTSRDGGATFDRIVSGIETALELIPGVSVTVRMNVDAANCEDIPRLEEFLGERSLLDRVTFNPSDVERYTGCSKVGEVFDRQQWFDVRHHFDRERVSRGEIPRQFPSVVAGPYCSALRENSFVVSPTGALFKCWTELSLDESRSVGHLLAGTLRDSPSEQEAAAQFEGWDVTSDPECSQCRVLPICGGGCVWRGMISTPGASKPRKLCSPYKFGNNLERAVRLMYHASDPGSRGSLPPDLSGMETLPGPLAGRTRRQLPVLQSRPS
ncbi:MAG TPA: radical SAM protein [Longimicrobiaceae bacterium]|nr:radical SAM protein [Longimicrobiaceae bacterium]